MTLLRSLTYAIATPRAALSSSYSLWLHWRSSAAHTASRHRFRNTSAPSQKHSRAKAPDPLATHTPSAKSFQLDGAHRRKSSAACEMMCRRRLITRQLIDLHPEKCRNQPYKSTEKCRIRQSKYPEKCIWMTNRHVEAGVRHTPPQLPSVLASRRPRRWGRP